jgi:hypothetical protein
MIALLAAGHIYVTLGKLLLLLPATEKTCALEQVRYGPKDRSWDRGAASPGGDCQFQQFVEPGGQQPIWGEAGSDTTSELEVVYRVPGDEQPKLVTLKQEPLEPADGAKLSASARKVKNRVRVEVKNTGDAAVLVGDVIAARSRPSDSCAGNGPTAAIPPGESLVDLRPGLLSPSMKAYVAVFTGEKSCRWVEVAMHKG